MLNHQIYKTTIIDGVEWLAENFRYLPMIKETFDGSQVEPEIGVEDYHGNNVEEEKG